MLEILLTLTKLDFFKPDFAGDRFRAWNACDRALDLNTKVRFS